MSIPATTPATNLTRPGNQTNNTGQVDTPASSIALGEPYYVLEHGWFADCLICGCDIEHGDTCQRVLTVPATGHAAVPRPDWVHEDCPDNAYTGSAEADQGKTVSVVTADDNGRPEQYARRTVEVSAMAWDGTENQARAIVAWVQASGSASAQFGVDNIFLEQWPTQPLWIEPSMVVIRQGSAWSVSTQERFAHEFRPVPRELPTLDITRPT